MKSFLLALGLVAVVPFSFAACGGGDYGSKCDDTCDEIKKCAADSNATQDQIDSTIASCKSSCSDEAKVIDASSCDSEADKLIDCSDKIDNICTTDGSECSSEVTALNNCVHTYCDAHTDVSACNGYTSSQSSSQGSLRPGFRF